MRSKIKLKTIRGKLFLGYFIFIILFTITLSYMVMSVSQKTIERQVSESSLKSLELISGKIDMVMKNVVSLSNMYFLDEELNIILSKAEDETSYNAFLNQKNVAKLFSNYTYSFGELRYYTSIIGLNGQQFHSNIDYKGIISNNTLQNEFWYDEVMEANGRILWLSNVRPMIEETVTGDIAFYAVRSLRNFITGEDLGVLLLSVKEDEFRDLYTSAIKEFEDLFIINEESVVFTATDEKYIDEKLNNINLVTTKFDKNEGYQKGRFEGQDGMVIYKKIESTGWTIIDFIPSQILLSDIRQLNIVIAIYVFIAIITGLILAIVISRQLSIPIKRLHDDMHKVKKGDLTIRTKVISNDEIGEMGNEFNRMVETIENLLKQLVLENEIKRKAEMKALQAQINPHFLYNTLACIRGMLLLDRKDDADIAIVALVKLLKKTLTNQNEFISINEEIENLKNYARIQQALQGEKLKVYYDIDENIYEYQTIKLILQPIVENSVFHGIEPKAGYGTIIIKGYKESNKIIFEIMDDGIGMTEEIKKKALKINDESETISDENQNIGLKNIDQRIKLNFGEEFGLNITGDLGKGSIVSVSIPIIVI